MGVSYYSLRKNGSVWQCIASDVYPIIKTEPAQPRKTEFDSTLTDTPAITLLTIHEISGEF